MKLFNPSTLTRRLAPIVAALALSANVWAVPDADFAPAFGTFMKANGGDESAIEKAVTSFATLRKQEPTNPVLMAYEGAATSMMANTTMMPWKKMSYSDDGMALIDKALGMLTAANDAPLQNGTPANLEVRLVAANTFLAVPGFMNRGARGAKLLNEVLASPLLATSPLPFKGAVWMAAANHAAKDKRLDDARKYLNEVINNKAPQAEAARAQLAKLAS